MRFSPFSFVLGIVAASLAPMISRVFRPFAVEAAAAGNLDHPMNSVLVAHDSRGRLRFRIPAGAPTESLHASVAAAPDVTACTWSPRTRSLLVLYDPENGHRQAIAAAVTQASGL